jgi:hypothetical protein
MPDRVRILPTSTVRPNSGVVSVGDSMAKAIQTAAGGAPAGPSPIQAMHIEHSKLLKAFRESEGRDPKPDGLAEDQEFWIAYGEIMKNRTGSSFIEDDSAAETLRKEIGKSASRNLAGRMNDFALEEN